MHAHARQQRTKPKPIPALQCEGKGKEPGAWTLILVRIIFAECGGQTD